MQKELLRSKWKNCVFSLGILSILTISNVCGQAFQRVLFVGNSISSHGPNPSVGWEGNWGMAASSAEKDYMHRVMAGIRSKVPDASYQLLWGVPFEQNWNTYDYNLLEGYKNFGADLIIIRIGENIKDEDVESKGLRQSYQRLIDGIATPNSKIVLTNSFWKNHEKFNAMVQSIAFERNLPLVNLTDLSDNPSNMAYGLFEDPGVAAHPGDKGMEEIANRILADIGVSTKSFQRYLSFGIPNVENGDYYLPVMEKAAAAGVNSFLLNVNWDHVISARGAAADWSQLDKEAALAERLGCKLMLRVWLARHDDSDGGWWPENTKPISGEGIRHRLVNGFSFSANSAVEEANNFLRDVMEHFRPRLQAGQIVTVTATTTNAFEIGYSVDANNPATGKNELQSFDFSFYSKIAFREWVEMKYITLSNLNKAWNSDYSHFADIQPPYTKGDTWSAYYGNIGIDWYLFRHSALKKIIKKFRSTVREVDPTYRFYLDMGSCYDALSILRGTLGFKDLSEDVDGLKVNDGPSYPHRFAMDLLRTNLPGKIIGNEFEFISPETAPEWPQQVNQSFEHGANWVNIFGFDNSSRYPYIESLIQQTAAKWLSTPVPDIQPTQIVSYTLSEAIRMGTGRVQGQWRNEYTKTNQPIQVILVEDLLSERTGENRPPVVDIPLSDQGAKVGKDFQYYIPEATFSDPDGYITGIVADGLPAGIGISGWAITGKPLQSGVFTVTITARDNQGAQVAAQFKLTVLEGEANQPPVVSRGIPDQAGTVGAAFAYEVEGAPSPTPTARSQPSASRACRAASRPRAGACRACPRRRACSA
ncbi:putative Ig domain-containing protein [Salmonirosea aquatica]|uniref:Family 14 glycosylhydrolase n=1 Tax=Salmonirosea aquatica TaxID=2654236 RepID=A0A7C9BHR1_9BACT|nr:family 14 glycosylhydrolase [Cytophagaceae bacterium SJW1-29]